MYVVRSVLLYVWLSSVVSLCVMFGISLFLSLFPHLFLVGFVLFLSRCLSFIPSVLIYVF